MQEGDGSLVVETVLSRRHSGINDAPPQEPAVPQEALLKQLAIRQYKVNPALKDPGDLTEPEYGQPSGLTEGPAPEKEEEARADVAVLLSEMLDHCARGQLPPPQKPGEHDVTFYRAPGDPLSLNIANYRDRVVVMGFRKLKDGGPGALERSSRVLIGDWLVAINGESMLREQFDTVMNKLQATSHYTTLRFVANEQWDRYLDQHEDVNLMAPAARSPAMEQLTIPEASDPKFKACSLAHTTMPIKDSGSSGTPGKRPPKKKPVDDISEEVSESAKCACGLA
jgi:hypothetical protein